MTKYHPTSPSRRRALHLFAALTTFPAASLRAAADWPTRPVRIIVPFTPGGSTDILARTIAQKLQEAWGQPFVVENRPGAGGSIGATEVARAAPDGYTLLMGHIGTLAINPTLYPNLSYDPHLPTIASEIPDFEAIQWYGVVAPARTPAPVVARLNEEINKALATPALKSRLDAEGAEAAPMSPDAFGTVIVREIARWKPVIEQAHMQPE